MEEKHCLTCGSTVKGRSDKKFCDDYCRNTYNNQQNAEANAYVRSINSILRKNRKILEHILSQCTAERIVKRENILRAGFNFEYFTHISSDDNGNTFNCCYEYGYSIIDDATIRLICIDPHDVYF